MAADRFIRACALADVAPESAIAVEVGDTTSPSCTAEAASTPSRTSARMPPIPLSEGDVGDGEIECYLHGSGSTLRPGAIGLPATEPVAVYRCMIVGGDLLVDVSAPIDPTAPDGTPGRTTSLTAESTTRRHRTTRSTGVLISHVHSRNS